MHYPLEFTKPGQHSTGNEESVDEVVFNRDMDLSGSDSTDGVVFKITDENRHLVEGASGNKSAPPQVPPVGPRARSGAGAGEPRGPPGSPGGVVARRRRGIHTMSDSLRLDRCARKAWQQASSKNAASMRDGCDDPLGKAVREVLESAHAKADINESGFESTHDWWSFCEIPLKVRCCHAPRRRAAGASAGPLLG